MADTAFQQALRDLARQPERQSYVERSFVSEQARQRAAQHALLHEEMASIRLAEVQQSHEIRRAHSPHEPRRPSDRLKEIPPPFQVRVDHAERL